MGDVLAVASGVIGAAGAIQSGQQARSLANYNARIAENNAIAARQAADFNARQKEFRLKHLASEQRAAYGKAGVEFSGSPLDVMGETAQQGELDIANTRYEGELRAAGFQSEATGQRFIGQQTAIGSRIQAGSSILTGLSNVGYFRRRAIPTGTNSLDYYGP